MKLEEKPEWHHAYYRSGWRKNKPCEHQHERGGEQGNSEWLWKRQGQKKQYRCRQEIAPCDKHVNNSWSRDVAFRKNLVKTIFSPCGCKHGHDEAEESYRDQIQDSRSQPFLVSSLFFNAVGGSGSMGGSNLKVLVISAEQP